MLLRYTTAMLVASLCLGKNAAQTTKSISDMHGVGVVNERMVQRWFKKFREGDFSLADDKRSGRPVEIDNGRICSLIEENPYYTTREIAKILRVSKSSIENHLHQLGISSAVSYAGPRLLSSMAQALNTHGVVPDVIDKAPSTVLNVSYPGNISVEIGKVLTPTLVKDQPTVQWDAESDAFYTLCMTDPDAPSRQNPKFREWHHWLVGNIPGSDVSKGQVLSQYIGSGPPEGTGLHRYVLLLYKQNGKLTFDEKRLTNRSGDNRGKFSIKSFAAKYKLGDPLAANMYQAEFDDYVPKLYKQLEG